MTSVFEHLAKLKIVPVVALESADDALNLADALVAGGLPVAEITFRTSAAASVIQTIAQKRQDVFVGAGTILTLDHLNAAMDSGAKFGVAPGFNPKIVEAAQKKEFPFAPGVCTPSEIEAALAIGCRVLKFFPASVMGGPTALKAFSAPYLLTGATFMPTGGISLANVGEYLALPAVFACGGTWIAAQDDLAASRWNDVAARCREVVEKTSVFRNALKT
ncbi:MAG: bifunctional 4-hydroxy-2-oxoglutarate aldolase/2-dehydro-3-deoxy-phosphogluconate aldolase [Planctomycetaceae bacterium]|jgi:2-dehydro-3-deoxyphosphogluconate aldolase/(4S)-4-hydroxy-2-oxoglutarate aldolase|nr:bifunctional 4-hydroxy-2-oxoglutarate aldolase/2-dehydro-3-deoxy-phosphogluconate aldolase [Planctomycetaceae bacterium]